MYRTLNALQNQSIRRFDANKDFAVLPYSFEENPFSNILQPRSSFDIELAATLKMTIDIIFQKIRFGDIAISSSVMDTLRLYDLLDTYHIAHTYHGNLTDVMHIKHEWDIDKIRVRVDVRHRKRNISYAANIWKIVCRRNHPTF